MDSSVAYLCFFGTMIRTVFFIFIFRTSMILSMDGYYKPPVGSSLWGYFPPPEFGRVPQKQCKTAMEAMVDLTNNLGIVILQDQTFSGGNFAFSPYGVASVLVVLYEGTRGESARQIHRAVKFPVDEDLIRTGFRDIHRHLRSYFSHESYLSGINLNKNTSSLMPEYKKILHFYGYDIDLNETLNEENWPTSTEASTAPASQEVPKPDLEQDFATGTSTLISNGNRNSTSQEVPKPDLETSTLISNGNKNSTNPKESEKDILNNTTAFHTPTIPPEKPNITDSNSEHSRETTVPPVTTTLSEMINTEEEKVEKDKIEEITNASLDNGMLIPQQDDSKATTTEEYFSQDTTISVTTETTTQYFEGTTQPPVQELQENDTYVEPKNETVMPTETRGGKEFINNIRGIINAKAPLWLTEKKKLKTRKKRTLADHFKMTHNFGASIQLENGIQDPHIPRNADLIRNLPRLLFLVDGTTETPVPMMIHTNVFPYAYIPRLHSKALEFPLDDIRYKLLILVPVERRGLRQLIYDLMDFPLENVLQCLRLSRVNAMVPTFMVEGLVILTSSLKKLGIWDVFDPHKADLSGMSKDPELYVRNVEQSVTVVIRNYVESLDPQTRTMAAKYTEYEFHASHPFVYFVLDTTTNIALMAGQILNPLNSRIY